MKPRLLSLLKALLLLALPALLLTSCVDNEPDGPLSPFIGGSLIAVSECGGFPDSDLPALPTNQSAVEWSYDGEGTLRLLHINAGFNCCPKISCRITSVGNTITVKEIDEGMCDCLCLSDAIYRVTLLSPGTYAVKFDEPYLEEGEERLEFTITIGTDPAGGSFVVDRNQYPWFPPDPWGGLVDFSVCGGFDDPRFPPDPPEDLSCIAWEYDDNRLELRHTNAVFNCCIEYLTAIIEVSGNHITITEDEVGESMCYCICWYDLDMDIHDLPVGEYQVTVITPYYRGSIEFTADLISEPGGYYCYGEGM